MKKLYKITTHNTMIETFEVEAPSLAEARSSVFDCFTADDRYHINVERIEQYFDDKRVEKAQLFAVECDIEDDAVISTRSVGFWKDATTQQIEEDLEEYES